MVIPLGPGPRTWLGPVVNACVSGSPSLLGVRLLLIRHGRTSANTLRLLDTAAPGHELDETGHEQAAGLVQRLADQHLDAIAVSDRTRTSQTAAPLARARGLTPSVWPGLGEIAAGEDELSPDWERYIAMLRAWADDLTVRIPGGESGAEFLERFDAAMNQLTGMGHDTLAVVSHGAALRSWGWARIAGFNERVGVRPIPNTTVFVAEGDPDAGWRLVSVDSPDADF